MASRVWPWWRALVCRRRQHGALPESFLQVNDLGLRGRLADRQRCASELGAHQFREGLLITVAERARIEAPRLVVMMRLARSSISPLIVIAAMSWNASSAERTA